MRNILWKLAVLVLIVLVYESPVFSQDYNGWIDLNNASTKEYEDGSLKSKSETFNRNFFLNLGNPITPMLSYQLHLRANFSDTDSTNASQIETTTYRRSLEPAIDFILSNPMYDFSAGYRQQEQWTTARLADEGRSTIEFYYSRLNITPEALPSLTFQVDEQKSYDHLATRALDTSNSTYTVSSAYELPSRDIRARYNINYAHTINKTPLNLIEKSIGDNFSGNYSLRYDGRFWNDRAYYTAGYQGHYSRNKTKQFATRTGTVVNERLPLGGFHAVDATPEKGQLTSDSALIDNDFTTPTTINIGSVTDHNIGLLVSTSKLVDRLYIYVSQDVRNDTAGLLVSGNWRVFTSNSNVPATSWAEITSNIKSVSATIDILNNLFRYEIEFTTPQSALYFKAVNDVEVALPAGDVFVTEIEALGTDDVDDSILHDVSTSFDQQINLTAGVSPWEKLSFILNYSVDRSDQEPVSVLSSVGGVFNNIMSDTISGEKADFRSNITRNYGITSIWNTHRLLLTTVRVQRNENFDNQELTDISSNTYNLSFNSEPIPAVNATLSFIKSDSFTFDEKESVSNSVLLSAGTRLYRDVNMITDVSYTRSNTYSNDTTTTSKQISGSIDALLTRLLSGTLNYGLNWSDSDGTSTSSKDGTVILTYRPGTFINISGNLSASDSNGDLTTAEGLFIDWLPLRAVRLNLNYQHRNSDPGSVKTDSIGGYTIWYITKFADIRFTYGYTHMVADVKTESYNFTTNVNCRF